MKNVLFSRIFFTDDEDGEEMVNNNDFLCISNETSPEKLVLPDPIQNIPQFDGINDENFVKSISEINGNKCKLISDVPIKPCRLQVADLKNHPWYGKIGKYTPYEKYNQFSTEGLGVQ